MGGGIARDIQKNYFYFQNSTKNVNKVGTINKVVTHLYISAFWIVQTLLPFLSSFKKENIFFLYPSYPLPSPFGIHWPINIAQKVDVFVYFQKKRKNAKYFRDPSQHYSFAFFVVVENIQGGQAGPLTGRPGLSPEDWASHREAGPLTRSLGF